MLRNAIIIGEKCPNCSKFRSPTDFVRYTGHKICVHCEQRHQEALAAISTGKFLGECSECGKTAEQLRGNGVMAVHFENGLYRAMCLPCDVIYVQKRRDLYGETVFGRSIGL